MQKTFKLSKSGIKKQFINAIDNWSKGQGLYNNPKFAPIKNVEAVTIKELRDIVNNPDNIKRCKLIGEVQTRLIVNWAKHILQTI